MFDALVPVFTFGFGYTLVAAVSAKERARRVELGLWSFALLLIAVVLMWVGNT